MAQKSIHVLNKNGYSMFWNSMWDDKINFSKSFKKQIFLQLFFEFLVEDYNSINFFIKYKFFFKKYNFKNPKFLKNFGFLKFFKKDQKDFNYENYFYNSKIWLLRYQNWFIIFFFIFNIKKKNIFNKKIKNKPNYVNIFFKTSLKLNFNFKEVLKKLDYNF